MRQTLFVTLTLAFLGCSAQPQPAPGPEPQPQPQPQPQPAVCNAAAPACEGQGPNAGCAAQEFCDTSCTCQPEIGCVADAPVCDGQGPNAGCDAGFRCSGACTCEAEPVPVADFLVRASRSTAVDITGDDAVVAMVNSDEGTVSFFNTSEGSESRIAKVASSRVQPASEPMAVVIHPDNKQAFVANRATGSISRLVDIDSAQAKLQDELVLGGEVIGLALVPSGRRLWATNWTQGTVLEIDTETLTVVRTIATDGHPFGIAITHDGDAEDNDEKVLVTDFYGRKAAGTDSEGVDTGRQGLVWVFDAADASKRTITLAPLATCFEAPVNGNPVTSGCFPNQLNGITVHRAFGKTQAYVTSVAASPAGPVSFNHNMQALVSVIDVETETEVVAQTRNLNLLIKAQQADTDGDESIGRRFINVPNAIAFVNRDDVAIGYVTSAGSDIVLRVEYSEAGGVSVGSPLAFNTAVGHNPQGIVVRHGSSEVAAYVANLISRDLSILSFRDQRTLRTVVSSPVPSDTSSEAFRIWKGKRFFNTSTGIWSKEGWGSCQSCHPMGLTDNVTWKFAAGPRQTISLDGQYDSADPSDMRALNWTAIFDETADFENNTRGVSGGSGAVRNQQGPLQSPQGPSFSSILAEDGQTRENHQALNGSIAFVADNAGICDNAATCPDWGLIDAYIQSVRSPNGAQVEASLLARGRAVFEDGGCNKCHAGPKWTISRTFYDVRGFDGDLPNRTFEANRLATVAMDPQTLVGLAQDVNVDATLIAGDDSEGGAPAFKRQACNIRKVGTFGLLGGAAETRADNSPAQGNNGFNPPSLLGLVTGAPYLHSGAAADLEDLFDARFASHTGAGNPNFRPTAEDKAALSAFLLSIDEQTPAFDIVAGTLLCPTP